MHEPKAAPRSRRSRKSKAASPPSGKAPAGEPSAAAAIATGEPSAVAAGPESDARLPIAHGPTVEDGFWRRKNLEDLDDVEWEALCDGCGRCCLNKIEDEDSGQIHLTRLACRLLDIGSCQCSDYPNRKKRVPECVKIDAPTVRRVKWLPPTCGYRLVGEGRDLFWWHPLVSGTQQTVHDAGISVRGLARSEKGVKIENYWKYIIEDFG